ncbi:MAG: DUF1553 domain-containing protein [Planctomycetes bacterium]|nr:DUF1553 domain-containing protein [Planctomycetota bacterium]
MNLNKTFITLLRNCGILGFALTCDTVLHAQEPSPKPDTPSANASPEDVEFFEAEVLPLLQKKCYSCHSHDAGKSKGGLVVDSQTGLLTGGESGAAIDPGKADSSLLIRAIRWDDNEVSPMPPEEQLSAAEVEIFTRWINRGAVDSRQPTAAIAPMQEIQEQAKTHWSFQPLQKPAVPAANQVTKSNNALDRFIGEKLAAQQLLFAPQADAATLIRRAYFDLVGLPPSVDDVKRFEKAFDENPEKAMQELVDQLLESPQYGERWARHWMDVARYSDVSGGLRNQGRDDRLPFAFTYRDYLIRAFNSDKPYNRFVMEQIAADQLSLDDKRDLAATGFLAIGSVAGTEEERIAERIDTVMQTFQGLTVGCARCHDHKFDPIPTEDYYALRGVIASTTELGTGPRAERVDHELCPIIEECSDPELRKAYEEDVAKAEKELRDYEDKVWLPKEEKWRKETPQYLDVLAMTQKERGGLSATDYARSRLDRSVLGAWSQLLQRAGRRFDPILEPWIAFSRLPAERFEEQFQRTLGKLNDGAKQPNAELLKTIVDSQPKSMRDVAKVYSDYFAKADAAWQAELSKETDKTPKELSDPTLEAFRKILYQPGMPPARAENKVRDAFGNNDRKRSDLVKKLQDAKFHHPGAPIRALSVADSDTIADSPVFVRGEPDQATKERVPRRFVAILAGAQPQPFKNGSGRLDWAEAMVDPSNPLTARVIVNRVWQYHFGKPLVGSTGDFGLQTPQPVQAPLLDWLAVTFMEDGWSIKQLHRRIMLSQVWQQSSTEHPTFATAMDKDPENTLLWRQNVRRMEFEPLRDSILAVTGNLDKTIAGRSVPLYSDANVNRRTVYALVDRTNIPTVMSTFDVPNPNLTQGERFVSTVSPQALFLMNNSFVLNNVRKLARSEEFKSLPEDSSRIQWLYRRILQRDASSHETELLSRLLPVPKNEPAVIDPREAELAAQIQAADEAYQANPDNKAAKRRLEQLRKAEKALLVAKERKQKQAKERARGVSEPADGWEKIIQTILMSNEFVYVL